MSEQTAGSQDSLLQVRLRVERKFENEVANLPGRRARIMAWLAGVSYEEWFELDDALRAAEERAEQAEAELDRIRELAELWKQSDAISGPAGPHAESGNWEAAAKARASMVYNRADEALKPRATDGRGER